MTRATHRWLPLILGVLLAAAFARLGAWQLSRLAERRDLNRVREQAFQAAPILVDGSDAVPAADSLLWHRALIEGAWDEQHEILVRGRSWLGSPGVGVLTPLLLANGGSILVLRGWLPAADGLSADLARARIGGRRVGVGREFAEASGLVLPGEGPSPVPARRLRYPVGERLVLGAVDLAAADSLLPYAVAPYVLQVLPDEPDSRSSRGPPPGAGRPTPFPAPELTDGPHLFYAFQWFGFAAIALAAGLLLPRAARQGRRPPEPPTDPGVASRGPRAGEESR
jgi:surfeit locus 1 family protein